MRYAFVPFLLVACGSPTPTAAPAHAALANVDGAAPVAPPDDPCASVSSYRAALIESAPADAKALLATWQPPNAPSAVAQPAVVAALRHYLAACGRERVVKLARDLIRFPTVSAREPAATGPAFLGMANYLREWSAAHGLGFNVVGPNDAWEVTLGKGKRRLAYVMHADVVPEGDAAPGEKPAGWSHPPYEAVVDKETLFGRGSEDDKGPTAAALVTLAVLGEAGLTPKDTQLLAILGTGEEHDWEGMERYAGTQELPSYVVSVDGSFPVVIAEAGFVAWRIGMPLVTPKGASNALVVEARGGEFLTQVPGEASMTLAPGSREKLEDLAKRAEAAALVEREARKKANEPFTVSVETDATAGQVRIKTTGVAVHSSTADEGANALWPLAQMAARLKVETQGFGNLLLIIAKKLDGDHYGDKLGLAYSDAVMGKLLVIPTLLRTEDGKAMLGINMRRPAGQSSAEFAKKLDTTLSKLQRDFDKNLIEVGERYVGEPALAAQTGPLVPTLLDIYKNATGDASAKPITIRGGTYARLFPGAVSFGPSFPGKPYRGHAPDESIDLGDLDKLTAMLLEATVKLGLATPPDTAAPQATR